MFRNFFRGKFLRYPLSQKGKSNTKLANFEELFTQKSLTHIKPCFNYSSLSLLKGVRVQENSLSKDILKEFHEKANQLTWSQAINLLKSASLVSDPLRSPEMANLLQKIETRFIQRDSLICTSDQLIEIASIFGGYRLGSEEFWNKVIQRYSLYYQSKKFTFAQIAKFTFSISKIRVPNQQHWDEIEKLLISNGTSILSTDIIAELLTSYFISHNSSTSPLDIDPSFISEDPTIDIENNHLWVIFRDLALKRIPNMSTFSLLNIGWVFNIHAVKQEGFYQRLEARFNEIAHKMRSSDIAQFAYIVGVAKEGSKDFWEQIESYVLNSIDHLYPEDIKYFVYGFSKAEEGSLKLWESFSNYVANSDLPFSPSALSAIAEGFAQYEIAKPRVWESIQAKVVENIKEFTAETLKGVISAFGATQKGDDLFWNTIEERILNLEDVTSENKMLLYMSVKSSNKLTPKLSTYFQNVAEIGDKYLDEAEGQEQEEDEGADFFQQEGASK